MMTMQHIANDNVTMLAGTAFSAMVRGRPNTFRLIGRESGVIFDGSAELWEVSEYRRSQYFEGWTVNGLVRAKAGAEAIEIIRVYLMDWILEDPKLVRDLCFLGDKLFGKNWHAPLAQQLGVSTVEVAAWLAGELTLPSRLKLCAFIPLLEDEVSRRQAELAEMISIKEDLEWIAEPLDIKIYKSREWSTKKKRSKKSGRR